MAMARGLLYPCCRKATLAMTPAPIERYDMSKEQNSTVKSQLVALCDQLKSKGAEMQPVTADQIAAVVVRTILIETASDAASDLIPALWANIAADEQPAVLKSNRETRQELINMVSPFITAASNQDKSLRKAGLLPAKPETAVAEFA